MIIAIVNQQNILKTTYLIEKIADMIVGQLLRF